MLVHGGPQVYRREAFRRRRSVAQSAVRPDGVVVDVPLLDEDLGLARGMEQLAVEKFVTEPCVEAFTVSILPR